MAGYPPKDLDFDTDTAYDPILNKPISGSGLDGWDPMTVELPGLGNYSVTDGSVTLEKYTTGRDGRDWWDEKIELALV